MSPESNIRTRLRPEANPKGKIGAGDGNRTHIASLEGWSFTTKLHPRKGVFYPTLIVFFQERYSFLALPVDFR